MNFPEANLQAEPTPDDRVHCDTCMRSCKGVDIMRRCLRYEPKRGEADQRSGLARWPELIEEKPNVSM